MTSPDVLSFDATVLDASGDRSPADTTDAPAGCTQDMACVGNPAGAVCDTATGRCVACTAMRDACPDGQRCDTATQRCVAGCRDDDACRRSAGDAGTGPRRCDPTTRACVECLTGADCAPGTLCVGNLCAAGCNADRPCPTGQTCCGGACVDPQSSSAHCGRCDQRCEVPNATARCMNGACAVAMCTAPFADCDGMPTNGCETNTATTTEHCGACGMRCAVGANTSVSCVAGRCDAACMAGFADCDTMAANGCEVDTRISLAHCGACGRACMLPNASSACVAGACAVDTCAAGFGDCDMNATNGCETDTRNAVAHCGRCGSACPSRANALSACGAGMCQVACLAGFADCDDSIENGCEVNTRNTVTHCGACGRVCAAVAGATAVCDAGRCGFRCAEGRADCDGDASNGCEADTTTSASHCGACGTRCMSGVCRAGVCATPSCTDRVRNGTETDVDCGGSCPRCAIGFACSAAGDCSTAECRVGLCVDTDGSSCTGGPIVGPRSRFATVRTHGASALMRGIGSLAGDGAGTLFALDPYGNGSSGDRILRIGADGSVTTLAAPTPFSSCTAQQLTRRADGTLFTWNISTNTLMVISSAGVVSNFSTVGAIGGGGACTDSGIQGLLARPDGSLFASSPLRAELIEINAAGGIARRLSGYPTSFRLAEDGAEPSVLATSNGRMLRVAPGGSSTTLFDALSVNALRRDGSGDIYFPVGSMVLAVDRDGRSPRLELACAGSQVTDVIFDRPTAGAGTSLYLSTLGRTIEAFDGDAVLEARRAP